MTSTWFAPSRRSGELDEQLAGEGVALTPVDAYRCMMLGSLDSLFLEGYLVNRREQPPWPNRTRPVEALSDD